jgi:hypothetical protein
MTCFFFLEKAILGRCIGVCVGTVNIGTWSLCY